MTKVRVHELAKVLDTNSKELIALLGEYGYVIKNHMSILEDDQLDIIFEVFTQRYDKAVEIPNFGKVQAPKEEAPKKKTSGNKEKKAADKAEGSKEVQESAEEVAPISDEPIKRKVRHVDTRQSVVDIDKLDTEKLEELVPTNVSQDGVNKQKLKKGANRHRDNNVQANKVKPQPVKEQKVKKEKKKVLIPNEISVGEFASRLGVSPTEVIKKLMTLGIMAAISQTIEFDVAALIAEDMGAEVEQEIILTDEEILFGDEEDKPEDLEPRSPVVVVMGHVDHGKTSLLDAIRSTNVTSTEAGGITQHIGAHRVRIHDKKITFLDTPGHEAFTAMRARGAMATDIAILVVAADDGVMPQTIEAINHAKAAEVSIIVAINKIDKEGANPDRIKQDLMEHGLVPEEWGGDTICVEVSAKQKLNIEGLLEMVLLVAEMRELKANPNRMARGIVIESRLDKGRGPVATVLVQNGTLKVGDIVIAGTAIGHVRAMLDDKGKKIKKAGPSVPVEITGLSETPDGGDQFYAIDDERRGKNVVEQRKHQQKEERIKATTAVTLDDLFDRIKEGQMKDFNIIVKADVQGS
ncbi:MAG: translation initiation factor IF-2, partial [Ruminococcaceae bacterium]|nr:translation initiation factor IF-2 [Oscillospiraceae bacterium]